MFSDVNRGNRPGGGVRYRYEKDEGEIKKTQREREREENRALN